MTEQPETLTPRELPTPRDRHRVAWVRLSDLASSSAGRIAGRGLDLETELHRRLRLTRTPGAASRTTKRRLAPLSAFGNRTTASPRARLERS